jgi:hypothetical protein
MQTVSKSLKHQNLVSLKRREMVLYVEVNQEIRDYLRKDIKFDYMNKIQTMLNT